MSSHSSGWRKALWCKQPFPDNHTDSNFLESLVINADVVKRSYHRVVWAALAVAQQVCIVTIVPSVAHHLHRRTIPSASLITWEAGVLAGGAVLHAYLRRSFKASCGASAAPATALLVLTAALAPVYATLTSSVSADTIVASSAALLIAHLYLHDYQRPSKTRAGASLRGSLGLACAMCASVLMASQLSGLGDVFALMALSLEVYIMAPPLQYALAEAAPAWHALALGVLCFAAVGLVARASVVLTSALVCTLACVILLCPMWLVRIQKFKAQINGPWDLAAPNLTVRLRQATACDAVED